MTIKQAISDNNITKITSDKILSDDLFIRESTIKNKLITAIRRKKVSILRAQSDNTGIEEPSGAQVFFIRGLTQATDAKMIKLMTATITK
jgi:hypothetical protein